MSCPHEQLLPREQLAGPSRVDERGCHAGRGRSSSQVFRHVEAYAEAAAEPIRLAYVTEAYVFSPPGLTNPSNGG